MNYTVIEEGNYFQNQNDWGNGWGFFVELEEHPINPIKFKYPKKYYHSPIPQTMETIREDDYADWQYNDDEQKKKKEYAVTSQIYSGFAICAVALYICLSI
jgi:hypothetical protein